MPPPARGLGADRPQARIHLSIGVLAGCGEPHSCSKRFCFESAQTENARKPRLRRVVPLGCRPSTGTKTPKHKDAFAWLANLAPRKGLFSKRSPTLGRSRAGRAGAIGPSLALR
eukprot:scaffold11472_cov82-Phaeocystis_antarctica.AAC.1